jgi:hypothetical protein
MCPLLLNALPLKHGAPANSDGRQQPEASCSRSSNSSSKEPSPGSFHAKQQQQR